MAETSVSVITPCYNSSSYISDCIESVLSQTFDDWEMLVIDDCSTDNSAEIIKQYALKDSRVRYLCTSSRSGGPSLPRNIGIEHARGAYIAFLDSDDMWLPNKLEDQYPFLRDNNYSFVYSNYEKISPNGNRNQRVIRANSISTYHSTLKRCSIPCLTAIISRDVIGDTRFKMISKEDYAFWLDILKSGVSAYNTGVVHALYRETPNSRSSNKLSMLRSHWHILRALENLNPILALYYTSLHFVKGFEKYLI